MSSDFTYAVLKLLLSYSSAREVKTRGQTVTESLATVRGRRRL